MLVLSADIPVLVADRLAGSLGGIRVRRATFPGGIDRDIHAVPAMTIPATEVAR